MTSFHDTPAWKALAKLHKAICRAKGMFHCVECKSKKELESAHCWPQSKYPEFALWLINLRLRCKDCNQRMGQRVYWDWQSIRVIFIHAVRGCLGPTIIMTGVFVWIGSIGSSLMATSSMLLLFSWALLLLAMFVWRRKKSKS